MTIADFSFTPATTTVHVGDTITWTNNGPSAHTVTARNGSFDSGILQKGASASHTFTSAGTFTYYCRIHPFMHGTIVVLAASATSSSSPGTTNPTTPTASPAAGTSGGSATAAAPTSSSPSLPLTGLDIGNGVLAGILLIASGLSLRRVISR